MRIDTRTFRTEKLINGLIRVYCYRSQLSGLYYPGTLEYRSGDLRLTKLTLIAMGL